MQKYFKLGCLITSLLFIVFFILIYLFLSDTEKNPEISKKNKIEKNNLEGVSGMQFICRDTEETKNIQLWRFKKNGKYLFSFITRYISNRKLDYFTLNKVNGKDWIESKKGFEYELIRDEQLGKLLEVKVGKKIRFDFTQNDIITLFTPKLDEQGVNIWNCKDFNNFTTFSQHINNAILEPNKTID